MRESGILLPLFSLPSEYGIGTLGKEAYRFIDFLKASGQAYWQMLPIGPTSYGDSPYQSFSSFAGNPYFIDFEMLKDEKLLDESDYSKITWTKNPEYIEYELLYNNRFEVLRIAYKNGLKRDKEAIDAFRKENSFWIEDYALFMALKSHFGNKSWREWDDKDIISRKNSAIINYKKLLKDDVNFYIYIQFLFFKQWNLLKEYAQKNSIKIIGDIPIYVADDSADAWSNTQLFLFDEKLSPIKVAGCPPDAFSDDGQLWGNPLYRWDIHKNSGFEWWIKRIENTGKLFDVIRIDHFRGLDSYYAIPFGNINAKEGEWLTGPGADFIKAIKLNIKNVKIIAEDLGFLTPSVIKLQKNSGFPGMKVLQFAFDPSGESSYLPHAYDKKCVVYTGTHDNDTVTGWLNSCSKKEFKFCKKYLCLSKKEGYNWGIIRGAWSSTAEIAVAQMQDFLNLSSEARINTPSTLGNNWKWRLKKGQLTSELSKRIYKFTKLYGRYSHKSST